MDAAWTPADVWILRSIAGSDATTGSPLRGVIAAADYQDHAIPLEAEFTGALGRLTAAGLAACDVAADRYWLTAAGRASPAHRGPFSAAATTLPPLPTAAPPLHLPAGTFRTAVDAYLA